MPSFCWLFQHKHEQSQQKSCKPQLGKLYKVSTELLLELLHWVRRQLAFSFSPQIMRAGFGVGGHYGNGVLFKGNSAAGYYNTTAASFGFQIGAETFGYAIFFMSQKDLKYLSNSAGWEIGAGASVTVLDQGLAESISSSTVQEGIYAAVFAQQGLMGGVSLEGTKITHYTPNK